MPHTWPDVLTTLVAGQNLDASATVWAMDQILAGEATDSQIAGFAVALRSKGETAEELRGLADAMLARATRLEIPGRFVDIVGTGGDRARTVNISSMSAVVAAGAGVGVVKHGNRAASSSSGTADVFEVLGIALDVPAERIPDVFARCGITFCFAPVFHPSFRHTAVPRRELGIATPFNFLGPLTNPAQPAASAIGCADVRMAPLMASVFASRGHDAFVFRGEDGLDEITITTSTRVWEVAGGVVHESLLDPRDLGFDLAQADSLRGADPAFNADVFRRIIGGEISPVRDAVLLNAGSAIAAHDASGGPLLDRLGAGIERAKQSIDSGAAAETLAAWSAATQALR
jgi:anthranilate phosphoribosyltransferase